ncbi:MAG: exonuclease domain-containing protein [Erysipelotrichales bacterium]
MKLLYLDVEWSNSYNKSICQIGAILEDFNTGEKLLPSLDLYINPEDDFDFECTKIHGIDDNKVANCKNFKDVWKDISKYFIKSIIVGHNVSSADLDAIVKNLRRYDLDIPEFWFIDTFCLAKEFMKYDYNGKFGLQDLCNYFNIDNGLHHDAFDDTQATAKLLRALIDSYPITLDEHVKKYTIKELKKFSKRMSKTECRREINQLYGVVKGIQMDNVINDKEITYLLKWKETFSEFKNDESIVNIIEVLNRILADNILTLDESNDLKECIKKYVKTEKANELTMGLQYLKGIIYGIKADEVINLIEVKNLQQWLEKNEKLSGNWPYDKIVSLVNQVLSDNIITENEKNKLNELFDKTFDPLEDSVKEIVEFSGNSFCLTGDFNHGSKKEVENYIVSKGGAINKDIVEATKYLVMGGKGSKKYSNGNYGNKIVKAKRKRITILKEEEIYK